MVNSSKVLSPEQQSRLQILNATRMSRRDRVKIRAHIQRQTYAILEEQIQVSSDVMMQTYQMKEQPLPFDNSFKMVNALKFLSLGQARRLQILKTTRVSRRNRAKIRAHLRKQAYTMQFNVPSDVSMQGEEMEEHSLPFGIIFSIGDVKDIKYECQSIRHAFLIRHDMKHPATMALLNGDCSLHSLGNLGYKCYFCDAQVWKSETTKKGKQVIGKHCCTNGKVSLLPMQNPPTELMSLLLGNDEESKAYRKNIRAYNNALSFVSLGAHLDDKFTKGKGVYNFRVHGSTYHRVGNLLPDGTRDSIPKYAQLYVYDTEHELENRLQGMPSLNPIVLERLQTMMHEHNPYANAFRSMREMLETSPHLDLRMVITEARPTSKQYLVPTGSEVAAIMPGQEDDIHIGHRDIQIISRNGNIQRISNLHRSYMPLLYVLLFPNGEDGWHLDIPLCVANSQTLDHNTKKVTQRQYYAFRLQIRQDTNACLLRGGRLLQQFIVDAYSSMEESRLVWIRNNQPSLRSEVYQGLTDMVAISDGVRKEFGGDVGRRIILPSTFRGGPRYMHQLYQDSMAIVRKMGKSDLFITFTCNPRWDEITNTLLSGQIAQDRPDLTTRVFYQKHNDMMHLLIKKALFGKVMGFVSVIEFQKRGLPHAHILLILENESKPTQISHYNKLVCAELPDKAMFPELHAIISHCNIHGPCGAQNMKSPCMVNGHCKYHYPHKFSKTTIIDDNGYPTYMQRDDGNTIQLKGHTLDNRWIVPYNPFLSMRYKAHINVEVCSTITAVKYLYKYVYKGHDRATIQIQDIDGVIDEVTQYLDARYVSTSEACWRIYRYDMHEEKPHVQRLQVHLPKQNIILFNAHDDLRDVVNEERNQKTTLTEWFTTNQSHADANTLLYIDFPCHWVWNKVSKIWTRRKKGNTIGRMYNVSPAAGEQYFLRILLTICKGCKSFEDLRIVNGQLFPTFKAACEARGLLETDEEWYTCLQEAAIHKLGSQLRQLFVIILIFCQPIYPGLLWDKFSTELSEDFFHRLQLHNLNVSACQGLAKNQALLQIQDLLSQHGKHLKEFEGMPLPDISNVATITNGLLMEEMIFDPQQESTIATSMASTLNENQRKAYDTILDAVNKHDGSIFFLDGPGGSGKTYLYNAILSKLRGLNQVVLACASSGIAALLLSNGRTAHSRFKIPLVLNSTSTCNIKVNSPLAEVLKLATLIIWDEAPMTHRHAFEALDKSLKDIMQNDKIFGGKTFLLGGDFRQILPVVQKGSREDIVDATLCRSYIWRYVQVLELTQNMRTLSQSTSNSLEEVFSKWILDIGNGTKQNPNIDGIVAIPQQMLLENNTLDNLLKWVYKDIQSQQNYAEFFKNHAILAPKNQEITEINNLALNLMVGEQRVYLSADSITSSTHDSMLYTIEYLNNLDLGGGYPPHQLILKINAPIILLRNLDPRRGLCNGTRLICKNFQNNVIEAEIITGNHIGERVFIPRITFIPSALQLPFEMRRRQFPIRMAFGITINKSQGQTVNILGLYLATQVFTHGQLYVAMSRVRSSNAIKVYVKDNVNIDTSGATLEGIYTSNVVYKEILDMASS